MKYPEKAELYPASPRVNEFRLKSPLYQVVC